MGIAFENLKKLDSSLLLADWNKENVENLSWRSLATIETVSSFSIILLKDQKFLKRFVELVLSGSSKDLPQGIGIIIPEEKGETYINAIKQGTKDGDPVKNKNWSFITAKNVQLCLALISRAFYDQKNLECNDIVDGRIMGTADIDPSCHLSQNCFIGAHVKLGANVTIHPGVTIMSHSVVGEGTVIFPSVTIYPFSKIGNRCRIHAGSIIGSDGFGYQFANGVHHKIWHLGNVVIGNNVEIGANSTIDRGTISDTEIGKGVIIDNLVHIAHNCKIGDGVVICGKVGFGGSVKVGDFTVIGGDANFAPDITVGPQAQIAGMSGVTGNVESKEQVAGHPARPLKEWFRGVALVRRLVQERDEKKND